MSKPRFLSRHPWSISARFAFSVVDFASSREGRRGHHRWQGIPASSVRATQKPQERVSLHGFDQVNGGKRILLPMASVTDIPTIPGELFAKFQTSFYADPVEAVFKAMGVQ